ncbi:MAG: sugar phosphate isomerase/epimerase [Burkholderiales bacterium]|nr:sugar phosphate isomerase/epimerase [Burkholderiales bacterium]
MAFPEGAMAQATPPLGLAYLTTPGAHPVAQIEAAGATGFALVGLRLVAPVGLQLEHDPVADARLRSEVARALRATGVRFYDADALTIAATTDVAALRGPVEVAAELGAALVQVVVEDPDPARAAERFAALCDLAAPLGLDVALEFMRWRAVRTLAAAAALLDAAARPNVTICLDCLHFVRSGGVPEDIARIGAGRIGYVQLCDAPLADPGDAGLLAEARAGRLHPGEGGLPLAAILAALAPSTVLTVEIPRAADAGRSPRERARLAYEATRAWLAHAPRPTPAVV